MVAGLCTTPFLLPPFELVSMEAGLCTTSSLISGSRSAKARIHRGKLGGVVSISKNGRRHVVSPPGNDVPIDARPPGLMFANCLILFFSTPFELVSMEAGFCTTSSLISGPRSAEARLPLRQAQWGWCRESIEASSVRWWESSGLSEPEVPEAIKRRWWRSQLCQWREEAQHSADVLIWQLPPLEWQFSRLSSVGCQ